MERIIMSSLMRWKESTHRKPLILLGARQTGKTYILKEFGKRAYEKVAYVNFDNNEELQNLFTLDYDIPRILTVISAIAGIKIEPGNTLIILDEIQEVPRGIGSLKYFCEDAPEYHVVVAGSLLGITMHHGESFPVGKVNFLRMYPMNFEEFLLAKGKEILVEKMKSRDWPMINALSNTLTHHLREYYLTGGMPAAVEEYVSSGDIGAVREIQNEIIDGYSRDISKHAPTAEVPRILLVWNSITSQLAKENKKFVYGALKKGARAKEFELAIQWLIDAGLVYKISRVKNVQMPLKIYEDFESFKLFMNDIGLMAAMAHVPSADILLGKSMNNFKGAFTENYVATQLKTMPGLGIYYYSREDSRLEIDFVVQKDSDIIPIEVKAEENLKSKSLHSLVSANPGMKGLRLSMSGYRDQEWMENVPLYAMHLAFS